MFRVSVSSYVLLTVLKQSCESERLIRKAVRQKANLIITPEVSSKFSLNKKKL